MMCGAFPKLLCPNQLVNTVHGALETYDLPDLAGMLIGKLTLDQPVDPLARPIQADR